MKSLNTIFIIILSLIYSSCTISGLDSSECEQDLAGTYVGTQITPFFNGDNSRAITLIIDGTDGDYIVTSPTGSALQEEELEQNGCGFDYRTGPIGNKITGEVTIIGDSLWYSTSGDNFGKLPSSFKGKRQ